MTKRAKPDEKMQGVTLLGGSSKLPESPETATLEVLPTASYAIAGSESATIIIQDADTTLPLVSIQALDAEASEAGDSATFVV